MAGVFLCLLSRRNLSLALRAGICLCWYWCLLESEIRARRASEWLFQPDPNRNSSRTEPLACASCWYWCVTVAEIRARRASEWFYSSCSRQQRLSYGTSRLRFVLVLVVTIAEIRARRASEWLFEPADPNRSDRRAEPLACASCWYGFVLVWLRAGMASCWYGFVLVWVPGMASYRINQTLNPYLPGLQPAAHQY